MDLQALLADKPLLAELTREFEALRAGGGAFRKRRRCFRLSAAEHRLTAIPFPLFTP
jgi:hypothetical protein